jgi:Na+/melibiose symporter-like transporter
MPCWFSDTAPAHRRQRCKRIQQQCANGIDLRHHTITPGKTMTNQYAPPTADLSRTSGHDGGITDAMQESLRKTKGWVLLVGIMLLLAAALTLLGGLVMVFASSMLGENNAMPRGASVAMGAFYLVFAVVYVALATYLIKYSNAISRLNRDRSSEAMEFALAHQQKFWRLAGVLMLLFIALFIVAIFATALPALMRVR